MTAETSTSQSQLPGVPADQVTLPTQSAFEVAVELGDYDREDVERLYNAVWPERAVMETDSDLTSETAANMGPDVRRAFTNGGIDAAVDAATPSRDGPEEDHAE